MRCDSTRSGCTESIAGVQFNMAAVATSFVFPIPWPGAVIDLLGKKDLGKKDLGKNDLGKKENMELREEREMLSKAARGDRQAAERLLEATYAQTFASLVKMTGGDRETAADLTQETYRRAWKAFRSFDRRSRFATWLYRIAYTSFLNHVRRPKPVEALDDAKAERLPELSEMQDERALRLDEAARLRRAVLSLPEELRFTVTARYWGDMDVKEIARLEKVTGAAIRKRLKTATSRLRQSLEEAAA